MVFDLRKLRRQFVGDFAGRVGRAVVDDHEIEIVRQLGQEIEHPSDIGPERGLGIMDRQENTEGSIQEAIPRDKMCRCVRARTIIIGPLAAVSATVGKSSVFKQQGVACRSFRPRRPAYLCGAADRL